MRVEVRPQLLQWAKERSGLSVEALERRVPQFSAWESGERLPTLKQLEKFAKTTHTPIGYLFLDVPPIDRVPIPDFRTVANALINRPSPDLLETIYICQQRQEWYREFARAEDESAVPVVGSASLKSSIAETAARMRGVLHFDLDERRRLSTWTDALRRFIDQADAAGALVMVSGVVGNNNTRRLNPDEFRGFTLIDDLAPLVFVNGADTKAAQMFTLAHELAHVWLGQSALSDVSADSLPSNDVERWCNSVAAEFLVPAESLKDEYRAAGTLQGETQRLARVYKVSTLVILRRLHDIEVLGRQGMWEAYADEAARLRAMPKKSGGDFYLTQAARVSKRFARALVVSTSEGQTLHRDAFRLLGFSKLETFHELGRSLGVG